MEQTPLSEKYSEESLPEYSPPQWSIEAARKAIPPRLFVRDTKISLLYTARDITMVGMFCYAATYIDPLFGGPWLRSALTYRGAEIARWMAWAIYWWFQSLTLMGLWVIAHESGHGAISPSKTICNIVGYILHTALCTPYFSWKISHHGHHSHHASMEKDQLWVPRTRSELGFPNTPVTRDEYFEDTPIYTMFILIWRQIIGYPAYLICNTSGQPTYPTGTSHFNPNAVLFSRTQRMAVILSDAGILFMAWLFIRARFAFGTVSVVKYYVVPWFMVSHWLTMITFLQHSDSRIPHFRKNQWSFVRGAACTVDRNFLGWQGRFFMHDIAHCHVVHHFFPKLPFYRAAEATKYLSVFMGEHYMYCDTPVFKALWETYNFCQFVEDEGDIVFYKNRQGKAARRPASQYRSCEGVKPETIMGKHHQSCG